MISPYILFKVIEISVSLLTQRNYTFHDITGTHLQQKVQQKAKITLWVLWQASSVVSVAVSASISLYLPVHENKQQCFECVCMHASSTNACTNTNAYSFADTYIHSCTLIHSYIYSYIHAYIHAYIHTYIHTFIYTYIHTYLHTYIHTFQHPYIQTSTDILKRTKWNIHVFLNARFYDGASMLDNMLGQVLRVIYTCSYLYLVDICTNLCVYICMHFCWFVCRYVCTYEYLYVYL